MRSYDVVYVNYKQQKEEVVKHMELNQQHVKQTKTNRVKISTEKYA